MNQVSQQDIKTWRLALGARRLALGACELRKINNDRQLLYYHDNKKFFLLSEKRDLPCYHDNKVIKGQETQSLSRVNSKK